MFNLEVKYLNIIEALPTSTHIFQDPSKKFFFEKFRKFQVLVSWKCYKKNKLVAWQTWLKVTWWKFCKLGETMILKYHLCNELSVAAEISIDLFIEKSQFEQMIFRAPSFLQDETDLQTQPLRVSTQFFTILDRWDELFVTGTTVKSCVDRKIFAIAKGLHL